MMLGLMFRGRSRQVKLAPVLDAAYNTLVVEYLLAGNSGNPGDMLERVRGIATQGDCTL